MAVAAPPMELIRISQLARRSEVPVATIKHYVREGLLPEPRKKTARNMAFYDAALVERVRVIKRLQRDHFLPLKVIKQLIEGGTDLGDETTQARAIARALGRGEVTRRPARPRSDLLAAGVLGELLDFLEGLGLLTPEGSGDARSYADDDLEILRTLNAARKAGLGPDLLGPEILRDYVAAIESLIRLELSMFQRAVLPRGAAELGALTEAATELSERLVVAVRRKLLLPTLDRLTRERREPARSAHAAPPPRKKRTRGD